MTAHPSSSLTLRSLLKTAATRAGLTPAAGGVSGLTPAAQALLVAMAATEAPAVLVVATSADVERAVGDLRFFLAALEGLTEADAERAVLACPSLEIDPYRGLAPHFEVASTRARALHALATGAARLVVVPAAGLLPRMSPPARLLGTSATLAAGDDISPTALGDLLADAGFSRQDPVDAHGEFCVRGGVVDFFPPGETHPVRLEFIGDTIESIRRYDPSTQRSVEPVERTAVVPVRELFESGDDGHGVRPVGHLPRLRAGRRARRASSCRSRRTSPPRPRSSSSSSAAATRTRRPAARSSRRPTS